MIRSVLMLGASCALTACNFAETGSQSTRESATTTMASPVLPPESTPAPTPPAQAATALTATGWGPLTIGMDRAAIETALGQDANPETADGANAGQCGQFHPQRAPSGLTVLVEQGKLARIELHGPSAIRTAEGFGVGDKASVIEQALGAKIARSPHKYADPPAAYLTQWQRSAPAAPDGYVQNADARGVRYEIGADGAVQAVFAGGPAIQYVEGCL